MLEGTRAARVLRCDRPHAATGLRLTGLCVLGVALPLLAACTLGPHYRRPDIPPPAAWVTASDATVSEWPSGGWWRGFGSEDLNALITQAEHANDDLRAAIARIHQADAQRRIAGAPLLPALELQATATRARDPVGGTVNNGTPHFVT